MAARALREEAELRLRLDESLRRWQLLASLTAEQPAAGVLAGAPVDLRALERAAALVRPGVGEGVRDWGEVEASMCESYSSSPPAMVWDVRGSFHFGSADPGSRTTCRGLSQVCRSSLTAWPRPR